MEEIFCQSQYQRANASHYMARIRSSFLNYFTAHGYNLRESVSVLDVKNYDPTVRLIGSHTNVLKKHIYNDNLPEEGVFIVQPCFQTQNLHCYDKAEKNVYKGSVFECHGLLSPYHTLNRITDNVFSYFRDVLEIDNRIIAYASSHDDDLIDVLDGYKNIDTRVDFLDMKFLRHSFGDPQLKGRDIRLDLKSSVSNKSEPFCAIISMDFKDKPSFVEVSIAPGKILQQIYDLSHYLDCFPVPDIPLKDITLKRKIEDCLIGIVFLTREGLIPGGTGNQRQILRNYFKSFKQLLKIASIDEASMEEPMKIFEKRYFGSVEKTPYIIKHLIGNL